MSTSESLTDDSRIERKAMDRDAFARLQEDLEQLETENSRLRAQNKALGLMVPQGFPPTFEFDAGPVARVRELESEVARLNGYVEGLKEALEKADKRIVELLSRDWGRP